VLVKRKGLQFKHNKPKKSYTKDKLKRNCRVQKAKRSQNNEDETDERMHGKKEDEEPAAFRRLFRLFRKKGAEYAKTAQGS
jgi:hypothetical protein